LVIVNAPHVLIPPYALATNLMAGREPVIRSLRTLGIDVHGTLTVERTDEREIAFDYEAPFPHDVFSHVYRSADVPFGVGDTTRLPPVTVRVDAVDARGRASRVTFRFDVPLEDPSLSWVAWDGDGFVPYRPPPIGARDVRAPVDPTGAPRAAKPSP
jgi:hypothetical protein